MKNKLLLTIIPLCLLMGACASHNYQPIKNQVETEEVDTDDEEFLNAKIKCLDPVVTDSSNPTIGVQRVQNSGSVSVRFVGLIKLTDKNSDGKIDDDDLPNSTVRWTRTTYLVNGNVRKSSSNKDATQIYDAINADGSRYTIAQYNSAHSTSYTHFVTYAIRNIPSAQYKGNILMQLKVNNATSKTVCSSGDGYTLLTFNETSNGYFLIKKTASSTYETILPTTYHTDGSPFDARFEGLTRASTSDKTGYIVVKKTSNTFKTYGYTELTANSQVNSTSDFVRPVNNANFFLPTAVGTNGTPNGIAAFVGIGTFSGTEMLVLKSAPYKRICFRINADDGTFLSYIDSYRLMLEVHVKETVRSESFSYTIHYEESDLSVINCRTTSDNKTWKALCAFVNTSYTGNTVDGVVDNLKWWSIRDQYTGYSGFPSDTFYGAGDLANAPSGTGNTKACYLCRPRAAGATPMGNNAQVTWTTGLHLAQ